MIYNSKCAVRLATWPIKDALPKKISFRLVSNSAHVSKLRVLKSSIQDLPRSPQLVSGDGQTESKHWIRDQASDAEEYPLLSQHSAPKEEAQNTTH